MLGSPMKQTLKRRWRLLLLLPVLGAFGFYFLITPGNPVLRLFRGSTFFPDSHLILGAYPLEEDFRTLKLHEVQLIISLLNPNVPYEGVLLEREKVLADKYGIRLVNHPMTSFLGHHLGKEYGRNADLAADAAMKEPGRVFIHCYLGLHRAQTVQELLEARGSRASTFAVSRDPTTERNRLLTAASGAYEAGRFQEALGLLKDMPTPDLPVDTLRAWSSYRLGDLEAARTSFLAVLKEAPDHTEAIGGLGNCALRNGDLREAEARFQSLLGKNPDSRTGLEGLGMVRYRQDRLPEAADLLERLLQQPGPDHPEAREILAKIAAGGSLSPPKPSR